MADSSDQVALDDPHDHGRHVYVASLVVLGANFRGSAWASAQMWFVVACAGNKHAGYHVSMLFTSMTPQAEKQLGVMARSEFGAG